jgi:hypothetical protein
MAGRAANAATGCPTSDVIRLADTDQHHVPEAPVHRTLVRALLLALVITIAPQPWAVETMEIPEVVSATVDLDVPEAPASIANGRPDTLPRRSAPVAAPHAFTMVGFELPEGVDELLVRAKGLDGEWSEWFELDRMDEDEGPDRGSAEDRAADARTERFTEPAWVGEAEQFQVELPAEVAGDARLRATVLDTEGLAGGPVERRRFTVPGGPVAEAATQPSVVSRAQWGAQAPRSAASYANGVNMAVVHHTAGSNSYTREQAPGRVRGYQDYHRNVLGWKDIGYNALIDRYGRIYEGREGGLSRAVIGAHAANYNTASFGVAVMGNFSSVDAPQAAYDALVRIISWKASIHGFDPLGTTNRTYNGNRLRTVSGHRDMGQTACPGVIQNRLWWVRTEAAAATAASIRFPDVPTSSVHRSSVLALDEANIIGGYADNTFRPANSLTRGQMATIIARALRLPSVQPDGRFKDVDVTTSHAGHIHAVAAANIVSGFSDGTFRPDRPVRRDQMATFVARARGLSDRPPLFLDVPPSNPHWGAIGAIQGAKITNGDGKGYYGPGEQLRRDQAASLVARAFGFS